MLHLTELNKSYGSLTAVDQLSLHVRKGEVFGLLGPNGAGKSTLVNLIVGLLQADSGSVRIGPESLSSLDARKQIGVAPQALALYMDLTAQENLSFFGG